MSVVVRNALLTDREGLLRLWAEFLREQGTLDRILRPSDDADERFLADLPEWIHDSSRLFAVAEADDRLVGFVSARLWSLPPIFEPVPELFIEYLFVDSGHRRHGIGTRLFEEALNRGKEWGVHRVRLTVSDRNDGGSAFWTTLGGATAARDIVIPVEHHDSKQHRAPLGFKGNR